MFVVRTYMHIKNMNGTLNGTYYGNIVYEAAKTQASKAFGSILLRLVSSGMLNTFERIMLKKTGGHYGFLLHVLLTRKKDNRRLYCTYAMLANHLQMQNSFFFFKKDF